MNDSSPPDSASSALPVEEIDLRESADDSASARSHVVCADGAMLYGSGDVQPASSRVLQQVTLKCLFESKEQGEVPANLVLSLVEESSPTSHYGIRIIARRHQFQITDADGQPIPDSGEIKLVLSNGWR